MKKGFLIGNADLRHVLVLESEKFISLFSNVIMKVFSVLFSNEDEIVEILANYAVHIQNSFKNSKRKAG